MRYRPLSGIANVLLDCVAVVIALVRLLSFGAIENWGVHFAVWRLEQPWFVEYREEKR